MREFFQALARRLADGPAEIVTVLSASGSTPRGAGAMMAVFPDGTIAGSVGGGNVEFEAQRLSAALMETGENARRDYRFRQGEELGMVCGGDVSLHFQFVPAGDGDTVAACLRAAELLAENTGVWLARRFDGDRVAEVRVLSSQDDAAALQGDKPRWTEDGWFSVPLSQPGRVYVFGGGHVSAELVPLLARLGFRVTVWDDRAEFADPARFPEAAETVCKPFTDLPITLTPDDYAVVMTRGHQADYEVLLQILHSDAKYLGCIGSRRKLELCRERLLAAGVSAGEYARLHAPIGLPIGAETPAEIAVSVAAELVAVRRLGVS